MSVTYIPIALRRLVELEQTTLVGLTPEGRTTIKLLQLNSDERLAERQRLETP